MKQMRLLIAMSALFLFSIVFLSFLVIKEKGNPLVFSEAEKKLLAYQEEHYQKLVDDYTFSGVSFDLKTKTYFVTATNNQVPLLSFTLFYRHKTKEVTDNYEENIVRGTKLLKNSVEKKKKDLTDRLASQEKKSIFQDYDVTAIETLDNLPQEIRAKILFGTDPVTLSLYRIQVTTTIPHFNEETFTLRFLELEKWLTECGISFAEYEITFQSQSKEETKTIRRTRETIFQNTKEKEEEKEKLS